MAIFPHVMSRYAFARDCIPGVTLVRYHAPERIRECVYKMKRKLDPGKIQGTIHVCPILGNINSEGEER